MSTTIVWNEAGKRLYEAGVDRAVLYPPNSPGVPWNGLISVTEKTVGTELEAVYYDGTKYADIVSPGVYSATIKAYTYPDELMDLEGVVEVGNGLFATNQQPKRFGLTYRTKIGNEEDGDLGYKIHILYNLLAFPSDKGYETISNNTTPIEFEWQISAVPAEITGFRSTAHLIFDTTKMPSYLITDIENALYGDGVTEPKLPPASSLAAFIGNWVIIRITDNEDGTWTAEVPDNLIEYIDATTFQINQANATFIDANTYTISDSTY